MQDAEDFERDHEEYEDVPRAAYAQPRAAEDTLVDGADDPMDTLDAESLREVSVGDEIADEWRRMLGGSWVTGALAELLIVVFVRLPEMAHEIGRYTVNGVLGRETKPSDPVARTAEQQTEVDVAAAERVVERTRSAASTARSVRSLARKLARGEKLDPELLQQVTPEQGEWLLALTSVEADKVAQADLKAIDLHATSAAAMIPGVRTPAQFKAGIAAVIAATTREPPRLNAEVYRDLQACLHAPSMNAA